LVLFEKQKALDIDFVNQGDFITTEIDGNFVEAEVLTISKGHTNDLWDVRYKSIDGSWKERKIIPLREKIFKKIVSFCFCVRAPEHKY
jgi:hypothetical protein